MPGPSKVIVLDPDVRAGRQIQLGFQREGVSAQIATVPHDLRRFELPTEDAGLVVVGGTDARSVDLVRRTRELLEAHHADAPIVFAGRGAGRAALHAAGADEVVTQPAYLRDVVTIGRLLVGQPATHRAHLVGNLSEITGVLTLVRALCALGRSAVLTLVRGLRRGEVRFFEGEVTSAQVGLIHGQAALHQLLLWTDARFDYRHEDIVRRQQIPLSHDELFADAERFLAGIRDSSGSLSPSMVLEQDVLRIQQLGKQIPTEVHGVLRMFDGHRVLADVLEDSPYRVFETLRVAQRAVEVGLLKRAAAPRAKATWRAVLAIEEWLVGADTKEDVAARASGTIDQSGPVPKTEHTGKAKKHSRRQRKKRRANTPLPVNPPPIAKDPNIDWGALVPRTVGQEVGPLAGVVPAAQRSGEIVLPRAPSRDEPREKLEALMNTTQRERIFLSDLGPTDLGPIDSGPTGRGPDAKGKAEAEARARVESDAKGKAEAEARAKIESDAKVKADLDAARARAQAEAKAKAEAERARAKAETKAHANARVLVDVARSISTDTAAHAKVEADVDRAAQLIATPVADAKPAGAKTSDADAKPAVGQPSAHANGTNGSGEEPAPGAASGEIRPKRPTSSSELVRALLDAERTEGAREIRTASTIVAETPSVVVAVHDRVSVTTTEQTARLVATPEITVSDVPFLAKPVASQQAAQPAAPARSGHDEDARTTTFVKPSGDGEPEAIDDAPSDGVILRAHDTVETPPLPRRPPPGEVPVDDRPAEAVGEISDRAPVATPPPIAATLEPSILVADLQAAHAAVSAVVDAQAAASSPAPNAAAAAGTPGTAVAAASAVVAQVRRDATGAFTQIEEEFFRAGHEREDGKPPRLAAVHDSFEDLDEGYEHVGFWDRLLGRKKPKR